MAGETAASRASFAENFIRSAIEADGEGFLPAAKPSGHRTVRVVVVVVVGGLL